MYQESHLTNLHRTPAQGHRTDVVTDPLYVITTVFNPKRYRTRWKHYLNFEKHVLDSGAYLVTIEATFGDRAQVIVNEVNERHKIITIQTKQELWLKENLITKAVQYLPSNWKYMATIDADLHFLRPDWVGETIQQLQHYKVIQMFTQITQLSPKHEIVGTGPSFMAGYKKLYKEGKLTQIKDSVYTDGILTNLQWQGAPGGAWAYTREAFDGLGGLIDFVILGSADYYMALGLVGSFEVDPSIGYNKEYMNEVVTWQKRALANINRNVGVMEGMITHAWHGKMKDRGYDSRWKLLTKHDFNPRTDLYRDSNGIYQLSNDKWALRDDIRHYFEQRNEDSIDM